MRYRFLGAFSLAMMTVVTACESGEQSAADMNYASADAGASAVTEASGAALGTVQLPNSCSAGAAIHLERGLALLHNMTYEEARSNFASAAESDPDCAMAYWGQAMTLVHPLWSDPPDEAEFEHGKALLEKARAKAADDRESAYVAALAGYYDKGRGETEKPNLIGFEQGWQTFHEAYPDDPEGAAFYALAQLSTVDASDKTFSKQRVAGALAERVLAQVPDHPGAHHYIIHAYDNPALSEYAEDVARSYSDVAPDIPHALHMPTHTFTRLGLWKESIDWNRRSADAALKRPVGDQISLHYFHALDYLAYAFLQRAQDQKASAVLAELQAVEPPYQPHIASAYTFAALPARLRLERHLWDEAAALPTRAPDSYPWDTAPAAEAITYFARALGAARSGGFDQAREDLAMLATIQEDLASKGSVWAKPAQIQRLSALAWLAFEEGSTDGALTTMRAAAQMEAGTEKHPVTPGEVLPARELLADMLLELGRYSEALAEYEAALDRSPNRFNSLFGAGRAAELGGDTEPAVRYYSLLLEVAEKADTDRVRLQHAREYVRTNGSAGG